MKTIQTAVLALSLFTLSAAAQDADTFKSGTAGFTLKKTAGWQFVPGARGTADVTDAELQKAYDQPTTVTLIALMREQSFGNFEVTLIPKRPNLAKATPKQILELMIIPSLKQQFPDFTLGSLQEVKLSGLDGAEYVATYTVRSKIGTMPVRVRAFLVPRGQFFFLIDMTAPIQGYEQASKDFAAMLSSIKIEP
ncbi:MAG TPA: hypothetical protein VKB93_30060 [Thermoanaerobaculia bacterium]|nr:hypothetical protein [Thermoanaerobaculia bacterium]